jgi:hypothetical protein
MVTSVALSISDPRRADPDIAVDRGCVKAHLLIPRFRNPSVAIFSRHGQRHLALERSSSRPRQSPQGAIVTSPRLSPLDASPLRS